MEWELRIILAIVGALVIGFVAFDGWRRSQKNRQPKIDLSEIPDDEFRDQEGFDRDGISEVRTRAVYDRGGDYSLSEENTATSESVDFDPAHTATTASASKVERNLNADSESRATSIAENIADTKIIATKDDRFVADESEPLSASHDDSLDKQGEPELIFSMALLADEDKPFSGSKLLQALIENGCRYGDMNIFHRYKSAKNTTQKYFSVANAFNPGTFTIDSMEKETFNGLTFFMTIPGAHEPELAHQLMVETARKLQQALSGRLVDNSRSVYTEQTFQHELEQIKEYKRRSLAKVEYS